MPLSRTLERAAMFSPRGPASAIPVADLVARYGILWHYTLEEASNAARNDSVGTHHLANNGTVAQVAGKLGNGAGFTIAEADFLSVADDAALSGGLLDLGIFGWFWVDANAGNQTIAGKTETGQLEWLVQVTTTPRIAFFVSHDGTVIKTNNNTTTVTTGSWNFFGCWYDHVNGFTRTKVNNGSTISVAHTTGIFNGTAGVTLGRSRSALPAYLGGRLDEISFVKSPPGGIAGIVDELYTYLWNSGSGRPWPWS